ncbi:MAG: four helix bundle protein [Candidatus Yonathbacteria bacterium RIFCSPHIGHO2_01_FULL_51_10]|uniref:Four helix bundle protein n=1 Tax=Candidatus Yonathbacteria bacterium RIFCSPHIGHO2_01_FULL_51_10 TaxID=1802723 RepID=A0A1G2SA04_9BACT|nr:MAG: four helix bundle protein [Candidatus Yonathbacteria bacterium RIFCSPHIGHO2_01_FULL_51_10]
MKIERFEDIIAWQKAKCLTEEIYERMKGNRNLGFKDQIQRAAVSVMNNIAEGFERRSNKEFKQFLFVAKGSCGEVRSMLYIATSLKYVDKKQSDSMSALSVEISKMLSGLIKTL